MVVFNDQHKKELIVLKLMKDSPESLPGAETYFVGKNWVVTRHKNDIYFRFTRNSKYIQPDGIEYIVYKIIEQYKHKFKLLDSKENNDLTYSYFRKSLVISSKYFDTTESRYVRTSVSNNQDNVTISFPQQEVVSYYDERKLRRYLSSILNVLDLKSSKEYIEKRPIIF